MVTKVIKIDINKYQLDELDGAVSILKSGGLVAFPTETVYGLGADALNEDASAKIYQAKGRPSDNPLIIHIANIEDINKLAVDISSKAYKLAQVFWPGPLTLILNKNSFVPNTTTGGLNTVAIRLPANKIARDLISYSGIFIAAPSANNSGKPSPTKAEHVMKDMNGKIDMILDGGKATMGLESTIVDMTGSEPMILRPGCITIRMLRNVIGEVGYDPAISLDDNSELIPKAPGMRYRHYSPEGFMTIYEGSMDKVVYEINKIANERLNEGKSVGIIATEETIKYYKHGIVKSIGSRKDETTIAAGLYNILREFDGLHTEYILTESFQDNELGQAIMNRLLKAAGYHIVKLDN